MTNKAIARALKETGALIELTGGNSFRARAFQSAARTIERLEEHAVDLLAAGTLGDLRGIGAGLTAQIAELVERGSFGLRDDLLGAIPPGLGDVLKVKGLGAKKVRQLWKELGIQSLDDLEAAATIGRLAELSGFGVKTQETILANVALQRKYNARRRYADAFVLTDVLVRRLRDAGFRADAAGELRRKLETVGAAEAVVAAEAPTAVREALADWTALTGGGEAAFGTMLLGELPDGLPLRLLVVPPSAYGTALWHHTGSEAHRDAFTERFGAPADHADEAAVFAAAGLPVIPPELREGDGELEAADDDRLPHLLTVDDLQGSLHNHSTYSDGAHTLREMAEAARGMGLSYFGICDHSRSLTIANGLSIERVQAQQAEIAALNAEFASDGGPAFRIFSGTESDILSDGSLDYPDEVLASFDFIVASVHQGFNMTEEEATRRVVTAIENPYTRILGHPTGRLLLAREGYPLNHERIIDACAAHGVVLELNAHPYRLDLDWRWIRRATERGVLIAINPDAHHLDGLHDVRWGVEVARKGWLTPAQCLNALPLGAMTTWMAHRVPASA